jgi:hypothetical protein
MHIIVLKSISTFAENPVTDTSEPLRKFPSTHPITSFPTHTHNGTKSNSKRPNRQTDSRRRASLALAARRSSARLQRCEEHGFLQSNQLYPNYPNPKSHTLLTTTTGVQRKNSPLPSRHPHPSAHNSPTRPVLPLLPPHTTDRNNAALCRRRASHKE